MEFRKLKENLIQILEDGIRVMEYCHVETAKINKENLIFMLFRENNLMDFPKIFRHLKNILEAIKVTKMKCVTFGHTSNGKSAVLNAVLNGRILPSKSGVVTSCFVCIEGCDKDVGYILDKDGKEHVMEDMKKFVDANSEERYNSNSELKLFLPSSSCDMLMKDVQIWDSPGVDYSISSDESLKALCRQADVFLLVIDANSTLNESERSIFITLENEKIVVPSMIFLINKWDTIDLIGEEMEKLKEQHIREISRFVESIHLYTREEVKDRILFISAKNSLKKDENLPEVETFKIFMKKLKDDLTLNAIERKLQRNTKIILEHGEKAKKFFESLQRFTVNTKESSLDELKETLKVECYKCLHYTLGEISEKLFETVEPILTELAGDIRHLQESSFLKTLIKYEKLFQKIFQKAKSKEIDLESKWTIKFTGLSKELSTSNENKIHHLNRSLQELFRKFSFVNKETVKQYFDRYFHINDIIKRLNNLQKSSIKEFLLRVKITLNEEKYEKSNVSFVDMMMKIEIQNFIQSTNSKKLLKSRILKKHKNIKKKLKKNCKKFKTKILSLVTGDKKKLSCENVVSPKIINVKRRPSTGNSYFDKRNSCPSIINIYENSNEFKQITLFDKSYSCPCDLSNRNTIILEAIMSILSKHFNLLFDNYQHLMKSMLKKELKGCIENYISDQIEMSGFLKSSREEIENLDKMLVKLRCLKQIEEKIVKENNSFRKVSDV